MTLCEGGCLYEDEPKQMLAVSCATLLYNLGSQWWY